RRNQSANKAQSSVQAVSCETRPYSPHAFRRTEVERASHRLRLLPRLVRLGEDCSLTEIADQVKGYPKRDDILEEKQPQKTHVPHVAYAMNGNDRVRSRYDHRAGYKEHDAYDEPAHNADLKLPITRDHHYGGSNLGKTD